MSVLDNTELLTKTDINKLSCLLEFYILATTMVIAGWLSPCDDSMHS